MNLKEAIKLVLADARAFACETCGGSSYYFDDDFEAIDCPDCKADREKVRGK